MNNISCIRDINCHLGSYMDALQLSGMENEWRASDRGAQEPAWL